MRAAADPGTRWITADEAAAMARVSRRTIMRILESGELTRYRFGPTRVVRLDAEEIAALWRSVAKDGGHDDAAA